MFNVTSEQLSMHHATQSLADAIGNDSTAIQALADMHLQPTDEALRLAAAAALSVFIAYDRGLTFTPAKAIVKQLHTGPHRPASKPRTCKVCKAQFENLKALRAHRDSAHPTE